MEKKFIVLLTAETGAEIVEVKGKPEVIAKIPGKGFKTLAAAEAYCEGFNCHICKVE